MAEKKKRTLERGDVTQITGYLSIISVASLLYILDTIIGALATFFRLFT